MIEMPTPVYLRPRKEPMTLDERKSGIYNDWRRDPEMVRNVAACLGCTADFIRAMDDYLVLTVTHGLTAAVTLEAAAKLQEMMDAKLRAWADSEAEDIHNKQQTTGGSSMSWYHVELKYMTAAQRVEAAAFLKQLYNRGAKR